MPSRQEMAAARAAGRARRPRTAKQSREAPSAIDEEVVEIAVESLASHIPTKNILIHGPAGHGKTVLAGGITRDHPAVFLSTETEGALSARQAGSTAQLWPAPTWEHAVAGVVKAEQELGKDDWLIVDSGTQMQELYMRWILAREKAINPMRDLDIPAIPNYQKYQNGFKRWYGRLIDGPFNLIFITTSMTVEDAEGETRVIPHILGKQGEISDSISAQAGIALYYAVTRDREGSTIRRALAQPYPPYFAKDRTSALGRRWDVADGDYFAMADMVAAIDKSLKQTEGGNGARPRRATGRPRRSAG